MMQKKQTKNGNILFTRKNPTQTYRAVRRMVEENDQMELGSDHLAKTGSRYMDFVVFDKSIELDVEIRFSNHTSSSFGSIEAKPMAGIELWWEEKITGLSLDLSMISIGIRDVRNIIGDILEFNQTSHADRKTYLHGVLYPSETMEGKKDSLLLSKLDEIVYDDLKEERNRIYKAEVTKLFGPRPILDYRAGNGVVVREDGGFLKVLETKSKQENLEAKDEYMGSLVRTENLRRKKVIEDIYKRNIPGLSDRIERYASIQKDIGFEKDVKKSLKIK